MAQPPTEDKKKAICDHGVYGAEMVMVKHLLMRARLQLKQAANILGIRYIDAFHAFHRRPHIGKNAERDDRYRKLIKAFLLARISELDDENNIPEVK